jgi:hypothetical protein
VGRARALATIEATAALIDRLARRVEDALMPEELTASEGKSAQHAA